MRKIIVLILITLFFSACKAKMENEIYLFDVVEMITSEEGKKVTFPASLSIEIPNTHKCNHYRAEITTLIGDHLEKFKAQECYQEGLKSFMKASFELPSYNVHYDHKNTEDVLNSLILSFAGPTKGSAYPLLELILNGKVYRHIKNKTQNPLMQEIDFTKSEVTFKINNNLKEAYTVFLPFGHINGALKELTFPEEYTIERHQSLSIRLSQRQMARLSKSEPVRIFALPSLEAQEIPDIPGLEKKK